MHVCKKNPCKLFPGQLYMRAIKTAFKRPRLSQVMTESGQGDEVNIASPSRFRPERNLIERNPSGRQ